MRTAPRFDRRCYWLLLIITINVPGFTAFDTTGRTRDFGLFNPQSISRIILMMIAGGFTVLFYLTRKSYAAIPLVRKRLTLLFIVYIVFFLASLPWTSKEVALSFYRLAEWGLAISLVIGLYASSPERTDKLSAELVFRIAALIPIIVGIFAVFAPKLALQAIVEDTGFLDFRYGGVVYPPNTVGSMSAIALYYVLLFHKGLKRVFLVILFGSTLILTYSRGALISFIIGYVLVNMLFGKVLSKLLTLLGMVGVGALALVYQDKVITLLSRGTSVGSLTAASGRLMIWLAGLKMFFVHPIRGWGFVAGVKDHILDYYTSSTFAPEHLHNELLQALVSGGIIAGILISLIYLTALVRGIRQARMSLWQQFLLFAFFQMVAHSIEGPVFSYVFTADGMCTLICILSFALVKQYSLPGSSQEVSNEHELPEVSYTLSPDGVHR